MINKIQNQTAFRGVFLKWNGKSVRNIKRVRNAIQENTDAQNPFMQKDANVTNFNAILKYGLEQLNDKKIDDGRTRYLVVNPVKDDKSGLPSGFDFDIVDESGDIFTTGGAIAQGAPVLAFKNAFDNLVENYKSTLAKNALDRYIQNISSVDNAIAPYVIDDGPNNA